MSGFPRMIEGSVTIPLKEFIRFLDAVDDKGAVDNKLLKQKELLRKVSGAYSMYLIDVIAYAMDRLPNGALNYEGAANAARLHHDEMKNKNSEVLRYISIGKVQVNGRVYLVPVVDFNAYVEEEERKERMMYEIE